MAFFPVLVFEGSTIGLDVLDVFDFFFRLSSSDSDGGLRFVLVLIILLTWYISILIAFIIDELDHLSLLRRLGNLGRVG